MTPEERRIASLMEANARLRHVLAEIYAGRWKDAPLPQDLREAVGRALLPGRERQ